jgi:hypothetical protein
VSDPELLLRLAEVRREARALRTSLGFPQHDPYAVICEVGRQAGMTNILHDFKEDKFDALPASTKSAYHAARADILSAPWEEITIPIEVTQEDLQYARQALQEAKAQAAKKE